MKQQGRNESNYFMYLMGGAVVFPWDYSVGSGYSCIWIRPADKYPPRIPVYRWGQRFSGEGRNLMMRTDYLTKRKAIGYSIHNTLRLGFLVVKTWHRLRKYLKGALKFWSELGIVICLGCWLKIQPGASWSSISFWKCLVLTTRKEINGF